MEDTKCGVFCFRSKCMQICANIGMFTAVNSVASLLTSTLQAYIGSQVPSIEKQFGLTSSQSGLLMSFNDIGFLTCCLFVASVARYVHIPRALFLCFMLFGVSGIISALPHFFDVDSDYNNKLSSPEIVFNSSNTSIHIPPRLTAPSNIALCSENIAVPSNSTSECTEAEPRGTFAFEKGVVRNTALGIFSLGMFLQGVAKAPRAPFSAVYIDDNTDRQKTGFYTGNINKLSKKTKVHYIITEVID